MWQCAWLYNCMLLLPGIIGRARKYGRGQRTWLMNYMLPSVFAPADKDADHNPVLSEEQVRMYYCTLQICCPVYIMGFYCYVYCYVACDLCGVYIDRTTS